jgi:hypothetical protein
MFTDEPTFVSVNRRIMTVSSSKTMDWYTDIKKSLNQAPRVMMWACFSSKSGMGDLYTCAAEAVFCYTAENSHHLEAQVTSKNPQFQEEKISERRKTRSQVPMEKSSKNYISLFGGKPTRGLPTPPPTPPQREIAHFTHGELASAIRGRDFFSRNLLAGEGEGGGKCETVPFVNGSQDQLQTQNQESQYHFAPLLFRQIRLSLTGGLWQASANLYSEEKL